MPIDKIHDFAPPSKADTADFIRRALTAWHKSGEPVPLEARSVPVTARLASKAYKANGTGAPYLLRFALVHAGGHVLAVYRIQPVQNYFMLRRMVRPPKDLVRLKR